MAPNSSVSQFEAYFAMFFLLRIAVFLTLGIFPILGFCVPVWGPIGKSTSVTRFIKECGLVLPFSLLTLQLLNVWLNGWINCFWIAVAFWWSFDWKSYNRKSRDFYIASIVGSGRKIGWTQIFSFHILRISHISTTYLHNSVNITGIHKISF